MNKNSWVHVLWTVFIFILFYGIISGMWESLEVWLYGYSQKSIVDGIVAIYLTCKVISCKM